MSRVPGRRVQIMGSIIPYFYWRVYEYKYSWEGFAGEWPFENRVDYWMSCEVASISGAGESIEPHLINSFTTAAFRAYKNFGNSLERICDTSSSALSRFPTLAILTRQQWGSAVQPVADLRTTSIEQGIELISAGMVIPGWLYFFCSGNE